MSWNGMYGVITKWFKSITRIVNPKQLYFYSVVVGLFSGLAALCFTLLLTWFEGLLFHKLPYIWKTHQLGALLEFQQDFSMPWYLIILVPMLGFYVSGLIVEKLDIDAQGSGADAMIQNFHELGGYSKKRTPFTKGLATLATLVSGGSAGAEGPMAQIGASLGSILSSWLGVGARARRTLFIAGMAGALGAVFRAPLGAAIIAVEILYREDFESDALVSAILASITGYFIFTFFHGLDTLFITQNLVFVNWYELWFYLLLSFICFISGYFFIFLYDGVSSFYKSLSCRLSIKTLSAGFIVGLIGIVSWESIGIGFGFLQSLIHNDSIATNSILHKLIFMNGGIGINWISTCIYLLVIILLKMISTAFTVGSGASGGIFGPSIFIGGLLGTIMGNIAQAFSLNSNIMPTSYIVVGMGGFFAGVAHAPIGAVIMVCELTGSYSLLAPLLLVAVLNMILFSTSKPGLYKGQRTNRFQSPAHKWEMNQDILCNILVRSIQNKIRIKNMILADTISSQVYERIKKTQETDFVLKHADGSYAGYFSWQFLSSFAKKSITRKNKLIASFIVENITPLNLDSSLRDGLEYILQWDINKIPIVDTEGGLLGYIIAKDILHVYRENVHIHHQQSNSI